MIEGDLTAIALQGAALGTVAGKPSVLLNMGLLHAITASFISPCNLLGHTLLKPATQLYFFMLLLLQFFFFPPEKLFKQMAELDINTLISTFA